MKQKWLKCDMHMHSQFSKTKTGDRTRVKDMSPTEYVDILIGKGINLFSITDHNIYSSDYYKKIKEYVKDKDIRVINGVELDVYINGSDFFQMGAYFDNSVDELNIENCIKKLYKDHNKPKIVEIINSFSELNCKFIFIPEGDKPSHGITGIMRKIQSPEEIKEMKKYAMYKIFSAFDVRKGFDDSSKAEWAKNFFLSSVSFENLIKSKTPEEIDTIIEDIKLKIKDPDYSLPNDDSEQLYKYIIKYGNYFAYFTFSDWHNAEPYNPMIYNYIFGDLNFFFEAFELSVLDPVSRIIKTTEDEVPIPTNILQELSFEIDGVKKEVKFSPGLNVIIGKRGSGKSLLLSVIENLSEQKNNPLKKYSSMNIDKIIAKDYNDIDILNGQLPSVAILTQDHISKIYEDPLKANNQISESFLEIEEYDLTQIKKIISIARKINQYNNDYKNITSILALIKKINYYTFKEYDEINYDNIALKFSNIMKSVSEVIKDIESIGLNTFDIKSSNAFLGATFKNYELMLKKYKNLIDNNNVRVKKIISERNSSQKVILEQKTSLENIVNEVKKNFSILLNVRKLELVLENVKFDNPKIRTRIIGNYLFVTSYNIPEDIKDNIWEKLTSTISKTKSDSADIEIIKKYITGEKSLKSGVSNISDELNKYLNDDIFKSRKGFYKINSKLDLEQFKTYNDILENIENKNIIDLSKASPGMKSVAYLDMLFDLNESILLFDQPEDNIDNEYISDTLVSIIKEKKKTKQLIFVTHNPSLAVYGDAFNYIYVENDGEIEYKNYLIEKIDDRDNIMRILEGGRNSFFNRDKKYGSMLGEEEHGNN